MVRQWLAGTAPDTQSSRLPSALHVDVLMMPPLQAVGVSSPAEHVWTTFLSALTHGYFSWCNDNRCR